MAINVKASEKQVRYAMFLLGKKGYSTKYMNAEFKTLGATMRARSGLVSDWLAGMSFCDISALIDTLKDD